MSGQRQPEDEPDFLDDDFILDEEAAAKDEELDQLFQTPPAAPAASAAAPPAERQPAGKGTPAPADAATDDADDLLFADHGAPGRPTATFGNGGGFDEAARSNWQGDQLDLDAPGIPPAQDEEGDDEARRSAAPGGDAAFSAQIDSLLQADDDFGLDSERELELVDGATGAPEGSDTLGGGADEGQATEGELQDTFVLDDGEGLLTDTAVGLSLDDVGAGAPGADAEAVAEPELEAAAAGGAEEPAGAFASMEVTADEAPVEPGWEPLPSTNVDALAEVDEVARADDATPAEAETEAAASAPAPVVMPVPASGPRPRVAAAASADEEIYVDEAPATAVIGGSRSRGAGWRFAGALAASLAVLAVGAVVVMRPEWLGLRLQPDAIEVATVQRPVVKVDLQPPPVPVAAAPSPAAVDPKAPALAGAGESAPGTRPGTSPVAGTAPAVDPVASTPPAAESPTTPVATPVVAPEPSTEPKPMPTEPPAEAPALQPTPVAVGEPAATPPVDVPAPDSWPAPQMPVVQVPACAKAGAPSFVRVGEDLVIGETAELPPGPVRTAVDGMMPGSRAFAQLHNGNYFIGSVQYLDTDRITLRVENGEVTLQVGAIARLTALGSSDYEELQKATSGFVRLTNNNRLVGGILRGIADDHIVLEFRRNRVVLPKSAVGEVVESAGDGAVRLDTTTEEDDWLRELAERQLGTGRGAPPTPGTAPGSSPPANPRGPR